MLKSYGWWGGVVAHGILVSAQVPLVLTLDFGTSDLGLTIVIVLLILMLLNFSNVLLTNSWNVTDDCC